MCVLDTNPGMGGIQDKNSATLQFLLNKWRQKARSITLPNYNGLEKDSIPLELFARCYRIKLISNEAKKNTKKIIKMIFAMPAACAAIPVKPRIPATMATSKKNNAHTNII